MYRAHRGSDLEKTSMSIRLLHEMVSSTLVAKCVAPGLGADNAMAVFALHQHTGCLQLCKKKDCYSKINSSTKRTKNFSQN